MTARLNLQQRLVLVLGLAAALVVLGVLASEAYEGAFSLHVGWTGYAPLVTQPAPGASLWVLAALWLVLVGVWVGVSLLVLRTPRSAAASPERASDEAAGVSS